ncbi:MULTISPECIES: RND family transporter [unclassified Mycolicibacterium]|uniref:MMPL/RND family transporter n=1 Tax=unclassified Mycolicibacterium TaxID=2636767 RepID=UPI0012DD7A4B|nr:MULTISPECIES: MMPL family transporter [unclassified Mycolicibacterium]MUL82607.1 MMPL family transporter [Mycolicibacterium sp. CBMA 329]MUL88942.1 MMPL family transporter [Mycolicibacterium sp. CBMA 331]MUL97509.1 MMPL family transporter [Mycolicibacterium sp. CBMA 334]MUM26766.1 MMPL family transporter [Mycolicibacterium sp. CBMA 295]MUM38458.1 MMPL family transporter [Mycolicibacterium sp. CBMA 247]
MRRLADFVVRWPWAVIGVWVAMLVALPLAFPSLGEMAEKHPLAILPSNAPSSVTAQKMTAAFHESGNDDLLLVTLINEGGLGPADEATYRKLVDALHDDQADVVSVQDFVSTPQLRQFLTSKDKTTWVLPVGLTGELGTPRAIDSFNRVSGIVERSTAGSPLAVHLTGPAATAADLTVAGQHDRLPIEIAIAVLVLLVLLLVYRSAVTMLLPLVTIGSSLLIAQSLVAGFSELTGAGVSNQSVVFLSAIMAGAGTDYAVFLISRYHDYLRSDKDFDQAVRSAMLSIGKVITASAATVGLTFLLLSFTKMGVFRTVGVSAAIGIGVAYLAGLTLLPAILVLAGPRGWVKPRRELTARFWRRSGIRIVRRPVAHLAASLLVLALLAGCAIFARYNYDDRKVVAASAPSSVGYAALERHFPINQSIPEYILIQSPHDLRTPRGLADLEQLASRVAQLPDVGLVSGITRPLGEVPPEFRATFQAGIVGTRLADGSAQIDQRSGDLNRLSAGANTLAGSLADVRAQINQIAPSLQGVVDTFSSVRAEYGGDKLVRDVDTAAKLVDSINALSNAMGVNFTAVKNVFAWIGPVLMALNGNAVCDANPSCSDTRIQFQRLMDANNDGSLDQINDLAHQLNGVGDQQTLSATVTKLNGVLASVNKAVNAMGLNKPGGPQSGLKELQQGANRLAGGSREVAGGVDELVKQVKVISAGLNQASSFLLSMRNEAADPAQAGFNIPPEVLGLPEFHKASAAYVSPDGRSVRYLIQTELNPFSSEAMDQVNQIQDIARGAQPNTTLADASISMGGFPAALRDTRDYYQQDIRFIIIATLIVVLLILMLLLRSLVAPLYLVGSVVISYFAALGIGVLVFQSLLGQHLHWSVPPLAFVVLVAVGADYNMLLVSRMRDESPHSMRYGIIRTLSSTGGVITAAGLIFAASMAGLLFSSIGIVIQGGFVIGVGILLDTFVVRTITVPAIAALVGNANWWPSRVGVGRLSSVESPPPAERAEQPG